MARPLLTPNPEYATIDGPARCRYLVCRRIWLTMKSRWFNNYVCKNEEKFLERLDQAILDVINNPKKTQKTACIGTLIGQTLEF